MFGAMVILFSNPGFYCLTPGNFPAEWAKRRTTRTGEEGAGGEREKEREEGGKEGGAGRARGEGEREEEEGKRRERRRGREREKKGKESKQEPTLDSKAQRIGALKPTPDTWESLPNRKQTKGFNQKRQTERKQTGVYVCVKCL